MAFSLAALAKADRLKHDIGWRARTSPRLASTFPPLDRRGHVWAGAARRSSCPRHAAVEGDPRVEVLLFRFCACRVPSGVGWGVGSVLGGRGGGGTDPTAAKSSCGGPVRRFVVPFRPPIGQPVLYSFFSWLVWSCYRDGRPRCLSHHWPPAAVGGRAYRVCGDAATRRLGGAPTQLSCWGGGGDAPRRRRRGAGRIVGVPGWGAASTASGAAGAAAVRARSTHHRLRLASFVRARFRGRCRFCVDAQHPLLAGTAVGTVRLLSSLF